MKFDVKCPNCGRVLLLGFEGATGVKCKCKQQWYVMSQGETVFMSAEPLPGGISASATHITVVVGT